MSKKGNYWLGKDGLDHGVYSLLVMLSVWWISTFYLSIGWQVIVLAITWVILTWVWYWIERTQARAMNQGDDWRDWSTARHRDMAWPLFFNGGVFISSLTRWVVL